MASMITAPMRMSRSDSRDISSCQVRCSCSVSPRAAEKSSECSASPDQGASDGPVICASLQSCSSGISRSDSRCEPSVSVLAVVWVVSALGADASNCWPVSGSAVSRLPASSSASSITLLSSASRICAWSSRTGSCSRRMACCSCGVIVSCWPSLSCRAGLSIRLATSGAGWVACRGRLRLPRGAGRSQNVFRNLESEILAQVHLTDLLVCKDLFRSSGRNNRTAADDVGAGTNSQRFSNVMIGDQNADIACAQVPDDALDIQHRDRVHAGERLIQQHELWLCGKCPGDLHAAPLAARQTLAEAVADVSDVQLVEERFEHRFAPLLVQLAPRFQDCADVVAHAELAEYGGFLRQIAEPEARAPMHR